MLRPSAPQLAPFHTLSIAVALLCASTMVACAPPQDSKKDAKADEGKKPAGEADKDKAKAGEGADKATGGEADKPAVDPTAAPWLDVGVRNSLVVGTKLAYKRSTMNEKGKPVEGVQTYVLRSSNDEGAGTSFTIDPDPGTNKSTEKVAIVPWTANGPFFAMEKPKVTFTAREKITVPAGEFEVAVGTMEDFFGNKQNVWMIVDKPGVFAKVEVMPAPADDVAPPPIVYELTAITLPE